MSTKELLKNIGNGFRKFFKVENIEKIIGFLSFEAISFYFSLSMYLDIGTDFRGKLAMGIATVAVEAFKVMLITGMSGSSYAMSFYNKRFKQGKEYFTVYLKHLKNFSFAFMFYLTTASVSFLATVGFGLATVHQYNQVNQIIDNSVAMKALQDQVIRIQQQITGHEGLNISDKISSDKFIETASSFEDMTDRTQRANKNYYIEEAEKRLKKIEDRNILIGNLNNQIAEIENNIVELQKQVLNDGKENTKSIFQLMEDSLNGKLTASNIMLIIVVILAFVIEVGLVYTSPKIEKIDEEKDFEMYPNHKFIKRKKYRKQEIEDEIDEIELVEIESTEAKSELEIKPEPEVELEAKPEVELEIKPEVELEIKPEPEVELEAKPEVELEIKPEAKPEPEVELKSEPEAKLKSEVKSEIKPVIKNLNKPTEIKAKEKRLIEAKKEVEAKIREGLIEARKDQENKQNKQILFIIDKLFNNAIKGENLVSLNDLSKSISIPRDKLEKVCKYLNYIGVVSYDMSNRTWKTKMNKEEAIEIVKEKLAKSKT